VARTEDILRAQREGKGVLLDGNGVPMIGSGPERERIYGRTACSVEDCKEKHLREEWYRFVAFYD
jgi:hypothetical protein